MPRHRAGRDVDLMVSYREESPGTAYHCDSLDKAQRSNCQDDLGKRR
jgi:hypothetical protein